MTVKLRRFLPRSLMGRTLLIVLVPLLAAQAVAMQIFYGSHLEVISRRLTAGVAGEIATVAALVEHDPAVRDWALDQAWRDSELKMTFEPGGNLPRSVPPPGLTPQRIGLIPALDERLKRRFSVDWASDPQSVIIHVYLTDGILHVQAPRKRLYAPTFYVFGLWLIGTCAVLATIAWLFLRNQVRAIRRLASAAEAFGLGRDPGPIRPEGASEVRQAATAFNRMQDRVRRFLQQRTEMLAGVSHDLRTPLTRLRLALAMLPASDATRQDVADMGADVAEMERLIGAYLAFARGEGAEQAQPTDLRTVLEQVVAGARRGGAEVALEAPEGMVLPLRPDAVRRAVMNLVDNACRHAKRVALAAARDGGRMVRVTVDDDGPGIPKDRREDAFRPFESATGTGLGLSIARDIVRAHGGEISLEDSPMGGLRAKILLPT